MQPYDTMLEPDGRFYAINPEDGKPVLWLGELEWETKFFGRKFGKLEIDLEAAPAFEVGTLDKAFKAVLLFGDTNGYKLIELQLDVSGFDYIGLFEENGFRLVETKLTFITLTKKSEIENLRPAGNIIFASEEMKDEILDLTHRVFSQESPFSSRFTNKRYFSRLETERYYSAWIENEVGAQDNLFAIMRDKEKVVGYLLYKRTGAYKGKPLYKAFLIAVDPNYRGRKIYFDLRAFVYRSIPENEVYLDTTTQLTNLPAIKNFIKTRKTLDHVTMIFYRSQSFTGR